MKKDMSLRVVLRVFLIAAGLLSLSCRTASEISADQSLSLWDQPARQLLAKMTLDEKIGQMTQADHEFIKDPADVEKYFLGSVLNGGSSDPAEGNSPKAWADMYDRYQQHALKTRLGIPLLYGVDAVHGHNNVIGAVIFPHNIGLGCTRDPQLVEEIARITAVEMRATGVNWAFAPCVTVPQDERWGRTYEGFSEDPQLVSLLGQAAIRGLQAGRLGDPLAVAACAKHYAGDGGTAFGSTKDGRGLDQGDTRVDETTFRRIHLAPYIPAVKAGVGTIMPSYSSWNGVKCSANKYLLTDVLKKELDFEGFLISDYNAIDQIDPDYKTAIMISVNAGMDMAMVPQRYPEFIHCLKELVNEGKVPMERIDDAVLRILRVKFAMGLMDKNRSVLTDRTLMARLGSEDHRQVACKAAAKSLVLLKNDNKILPLSKKIARIHVAGKNADDLGSQCGGWTIDWQGRTGQVTEGGTTILNAIRQAVSTNTQVTFSKDGTGADGADVGIAVIGETPYAEMKGDRDNLNLDSQDIETVEKMKKAGIPVVVILISGRPMIITSILDKADAFIAAWLPGTEGQGVADVVFGNQKPSGKLSYSWPRDNSQIPVNIGDSDYNPLFPYGFGLTY
ncbi:MAG: glycoside hydrolase family 3 C-terminal domain-containing protein [Phycisphaerae bacterium]|nr:glycoside hydrolase family 3 C-terminal domain-containing protein [Phycisphaerae bacterium]